MSSNSTCLRHLKKHSEGFWFQKCDSAAWVGAVGVGLQVRKCEGRFAVGVDAATS